MAGGEILSARRWLDVVFRGGRRTILAFHGNRGAENDFPRWTRAKIAFSLSTFSAKPWSPPSSLPAMVSKLAHSPPTRSAGCWQAAALKSSDLAWREGMAKAAPTRNLALGTALTGMACVPLAAAAAGRKAPAKMGPGRRVAVCAGARRRGCVAVPGTAALVAADEMKWE